MGNDLDPLILDLLEWIARTPRSYADVLDAWRTSCPRLTVWEDCVDRGYAMREYHAGREVMVGLTQAGRDFLRARGRTARDQQAGDVAATEAARASTAPRNLVPERR